MSLIHMKEYMGKLLENFSMVLDLEMTILNINPLERIASTASFFGAIPLNAVGELEEYWKSSYTTKVVQTGKSLIAIDTSEYVRQSRSLREREGSKYYSVIAVPIYLNQTLEGVIVLASFNEEQQKTLIEKQNKLLKYMENLADLIASKEREQHLLQIKTESENQLRTVINTIQDGAVLYSKEREILQINDCARSYLHFEDWEVKQVLLREVGDAARKAIEAEEMVTSEIYKTIGKVQFSLQVQACPVEGSGGVVLCVITPFSKIRNDITKNVFGDDIERDVIFSSCKMREVVERTQIIAENSLNVLVTGESGTGKELFARMIHARGERNGKPFVSVNCAAIPESLLESELFGYEEGAFTGAKKGGRMGKFLLANQGTLFLDEIGELPLYLQAKLLRVLSERKVDRVGGKAPVDVDVRIIAATNRNLEAMIEAKEFREDLFYRLNVVSVHVPPLRERKDDLFVLSKYFIEKYNGILKKNVRQISDETLQVMRRYDWPGNVRELENAIEYAMTFTVGGSLLPESLPPRVLGLDEKGATKELINFHKPLKKSVEEFECSVLEKIALEYGGHPTKAQVKEICTMLNIGVSSYYRKIKKQDT